FGLGIALGRRFANSLKDCRVKYLPLDRQILPFADDRRATAATRGEPRCCRDHRRSAARDFAELCHPEAFRPVFSLPQTVKEVNILQHVTALAALLGLSYATAADNSVAQNPHGAAAVFESLGSAILMPVQQCEIVESTRDNHVLGAERFLLYGQGALIQRLGL